MKAFIIPVILVVLTTSCMNKKDTKSTTDDKSGVSLIREGAELVLLADGFTFTEGPTSDKAGNVYFTDQPNNRIMLWTIDSKLETFMEPSGRSNGLYIDKQGMLWACADEKNEMWLINQDKNVEVLFDSFLGNKLDGPNDVWVMDNGNAYMTDPYYQRPWWEKQKPEQEDRGVYLYDREFRLLKLVAEDLVQPNGIVGTADNKFLYVADIDDSKVYKYNIEVDGSLHNKTLFCNTNSDGMTLDEKCNLYVTNEKGVTVFDTTGQQILNIPVDQPWTANVCFGGIEHKTLFITAMTGLYAIEMNVKGMQWE